MLTFAAEFVAKFVTSDEGSDSETSNSAEDESYAFVSGVLQEVLDVGHNRSVSNKVLEQVWF